MPRPSTAHLVLIASSLAPCADAHAQYAIDWHTIDGGGGVSSGGSYELSGTIGQHDAGPLVQGGSFDLSGGFWAAGASPGRCPADFSGDGTLDSRDVIAFLNAWSAREDAADCDASGVVDSRDVVCFLSAWSAGC
ncbi:MAG TPA: GC-type dockerin domain-anchored protein [Phycisphaerales bacterium]|nr:GC-type dockerin domain-anchored protein [Phycisphaerales bacterium]